MRELFQTADETEGKTANGQKTDDINLGQPPKLKVLNPEQFHLRTTSEILLEDVMPWHFQNGCAYHIFAYGTIMSISFLRLILKQQPLEYLSISSLSMSPTDLAILEKWVDKGLVKRLDLYAHQFVGAQQMSCYTTAFELAKKTGGRVGLLRNHSKVMTGFGEKFDFVIEGSANLCSNGNCEQVCINIDSGLARWYKEEIFDNIQSFNRDFDDWQPYKLKRDETL